MSSRMFLFRYVRITLCVLSVQLYMPIISSVSIASYLLLITLRIVRSSSNYIILITTLVIINVNTAIPTSIQPVSSKTHLIVYIK